MIRVGFCPPTHLGKIMDLIRSDVRISLGWQDRPFWPKSGQCQLKPQLRDHDLEREVARSLCASLLGSSEHSLFLWSLSWGQIAQEQGEKLSHAALKLQLLSLLKPMSAGRQGPWSPQVEASRDTCPSTCSAVAVSLVRKERREHLLSGLQSSWSYPRLWLKSPVSGFINLGGGWLRYGHEAVFV